jgi:streptogramin lyase
MRSYCLSACRFALALILCPASVGAQDLLVASMGTDQVLRYHGTTGAPMGVFASGSFDGPEAMTYGPDGNLYVIGAFSNNVVRFNGVTGAFIDEFVASGAGGLSNPTDLEFGADGHLYVLPHGSLGSESVWKYDGSTGAFIGLFGAGGGMAHTHGLTWGPDGNLYHGRLSEATIARFNSSGASLGELGPHGGLSTLSDLAFGPDGNIYVTSLSPGGVLRYDSGGTFIDEFVSSGVSTWGIRFGPDAKLYVGFTGAMSLVNRYDALTGVFIDEFVSDGEGGLAFPFGFAFMPIPEPGGFAIAALAGATVLHRRRRR